uniref:Metalloendopeptidase n=1 Tax=Parastrongyloides trichosuri TaxID=131310 RepID=A0A0N4ZAB3_PARTI
RYIYRTGDESRVYFKNHGNLSNINYTNLIKLRSMKKRAINVDLDVNWTSPILYYIDKKLNSKRILQVLKYIQENTCIKFLEGPPTNQGKTRLIYVKKNFCSSLIGKALYEYQDTDVWLTDYCASNFGMVGHETLHALGLRHEHQRHDRDNFVEIYNENIPPSFLDESKTIYSRNFETFDIPYDYGSIMHYAGKLVETNGKIFMKVKNIDPYNEMIGQIDMFSFNDIKLINHYYCSKNCSMSQHKCKNGGYIHWYQCGTCICPKGYYGRDCGYFKQISNYCG